MPLNHELHEHVPQTPQSGESHHPAKAAPRGAEEKGEAPTPDRCPLQGKVMGSGYTRDST